MFSTIFTTIYNKISFEDMQQCIHNNSIIINTLSNTKQNCLIKNTIHYYEEENVVNKLLDNYSSTQKNIIIYGENSIDNTPEKKYDQLKKCGFYNIYIYPGGLFEWLLLQDIYGDDEFPTTSKLLDILQFKPNRKL
jgi:hypothetical protein